MAVPAAPAQRLGTPFGRVGSPGLSSRALSLGRRPDATVHNEIAPRSRYSGNTARLFEAAAPGRSTLITRWGGRGGGEA